MTEPQLPRTSGRHLTDVMGSKPVVVVSHGAWHVPAHYEPIVAPLREAGYEVLVPQHFSVSTNMKQDPGDALHRDAAAIAQILRDVTNSGKDVILLMHSYGGVAGCEAVGMLYEDQPPGPGRIRKLVFFAAHVIEKDQPFLPDGRLIPDTNIEAGMMIHEKPYERYYSEVSQEDAAPAIALLEPMAVSAFHTPTRYAGWKDYSIPCTYIVCQGDKAVTPTMVRTYIDRLQSGGAEVSVDSIDAGHCSHYTDPGKVVDVVIRIASST